MQQFSYQKNFQAQVEFKLVKSIAGFNKAIAEQEVPIVMIPILETE